METTSSAETTIIKRLSNLSAPVISDAMAKLLSDRLKHQTMDSAIKPIDRSVKVCGLAYTVRCYPGATFAMEKAIAEAPQNSVIVCNGQGSDAGVMMGELMSTFAQQRGVLGAVIDGAVRDIDGIIELGFPVFARHITPRSGTFDKLGDVQQVITCGSVVVNPGDIVMGDINGVVVVPKQIATEVTEAAEQLQEWEDKVKRLVLKGKSLEEAAAACNSPSVYNVS